MSRVLKHPLVWLVILTAVAIIILKHITPDQNSRLFIPAVMTTISCMYALAALSMVVRTRLWCWSILSAGLLGTFVADAVWWMSLYQNGRGQPWFVEHKDNLLIFVEALFAVGSVFVVVGLVQEWWRERCERRTNEE